MYRTLIRDRACQTHRADVRAVFIKYHKPIGARMSESASKEILPQTAILLDFAAV